MARVPRKPTQIYRRKKSVYKKKYCRDIVVHLSKGKSIASFRAAHGINRKAFDNWRGRYPEFEEHVELALDACQAWWENIYMQVVTGKHKDPENPNQFLQYASESGIRFILQQRFSEYNSKKEIKQEIENTVKLYRAEIKKGGIVEKSKKEVDREDMTDDELFALFDDGAVTKDAGVVWEE